MVSKRPDRKPVQMSLFEADTVTTSWVALRFKTSRDTIERMLQEGLLRGYRITPRGWFRIIKKSVLEHEERMRVEAGFNTESEAKR